MLYLLLMLLGLGLSALMSATETAFYNLDRLWLAEQERAKVPGAAGIARELQNMPLVLTTILIANNFANNLGTQGFAYFATAAVLPAPEIVTTLVVVPLFFFCGEMLPKRYGYFHANEFVLRIHPFFMGLRWFLAPVARKLSAIGAAMNSLLEKIGGGEGLAGREALVANLENSLAQGDLSPLQWQLTARVMEMESLKVSRVMVPLAAVFALNANTPVEEAGAAIRRRGLAHALLLDAQNRPTGELIELAALLTLAAPDAKKSLIPAADLARPVPRFTAAAPVMTTWETLRQQAAPVGFVCAKSGAIVGVITVAHLTDYLLGAVTGARWDF
jgi:putative hemolysin